MSETYPSAVAFRHLRDGITGPRVIVRLWNSRDAEGLFGAVDDSRAHLRPWMEWVDRHQNVGDTIEYITRALMEFTRREQIALGIFDIRDNSTVLGATGFHDIDWAVPSLEIGYWITPFAQGKGYISEAVSLITEFALTEFSANRIGIHCDPLNVRSRNVAERLGFQFEGRLRNRARTPDGGLRDTMVYSMIPGQQKTPVLRTEANARD